MCVCVCVCVCVFSLRTGLAQWILCVRSLTVIHRGLRQIPDGSCLNNVANHKLLDGLVLEGKGEEGRRLLSENNLSPHQST